LTAENAEERREKMMRVEIMKGFLMARFKSLSDLISNPDNCFDFFCDPLRPLRLKDFFIIHLFRMEIDIC
jgi:hypothetical protein